MPLLGIVQRGVSARKPLSWTFPVGRDGTEPRTLRFSAECQLSGTVRDHTPESHPTCSARWRRTLSFGSIPVRTARCGPFGQNAGRIAPAPRPAHRRRQEPPRRQAVPPTRHRPPAVPAAGTLRPPLSRNPPGSLTAHGSLRLLTVRSGCGPRIPTAWRAHGAELSIGHPNTPPAAR
jgi:hypothetical protein